MSPSLLKKFVRYRTVITAIANAAITWTILIIAPLGLFAVITCTLGVFLGSLLIGNLSDKALLFLVGNSDRQNINPNRSIDSVDILNADYMSNDAASSTNDFLDQKQTKRLQK
ncbi:MAG: CRISPR-associated protein Csx18 [Pseudanabaenaceae cyanobacterium bins.39]|nr:CRISPR-associated protein Csx18 [Pseudanabaenaceae cyanobacterium bins.39]